MHDVLRKVWHSVRGGRRAGLVAAAIVLGATAGAVGGANLTFAVLVLALLMFNTPLAFAAVAACCGLLLRAVVGSLLQSLGAFLLNKAGLGVVVESLGHGVAAGLSGWSDHQLVGAAAVAFVASLPLAHAAFRRYASTAGDPSSDRDPLWRPHGWLPAGAWIVVVAVLPQSLASHRACDSVLAHLSAAVEAPVTARKTTYELWTGRMRLEDLTIEGAAGASRPTLRIDRLDAELDPGLLVRGRLHCESAVVVGLHYDAEAGVAPPARLFPNEPTFLREGGAQARELPPAQPIDVDDLLADWTGIQKKLGLVSRLIEAVEGTADCEEPRSPVARRLAALRRPTLEPCDPLSGRAEPLVQIKRLRIEPLPSTWGFGPQAKLELSNLSSRPSSAARGALALVDDPTRDLQITLDFRPTTAERKHDLIVVCNRSLGTSLFDVRRLREVGFDATSAQLTSLRGRGWATRDRLELPLVCEVHGVRLSSGSTRFGGVDFAVWRESFSKLGGLRFESTLGGRWAAPHVQVVPQALVDQMKHQLRSAGEHTLVGAVTAGRLSSTQDPAKAPASASASTSSPPTAAVGPLAQAAPPSMPYASSSNPPIASPTVPRPEPASVAVEVKPSATSPVTPVVLSQPASIAAPLATTSVEASANTTAPPNATAPTNPLAPSNTNEVVKSNVPSPTQALPTVSEPTVNPTATITTTPAAPPATATSVPTDQAATAEPTSAPPKASAFDRVAGDTSAALKEAEAKKLPRATDAASANHSPVATSPTADAAAAQASDAPTTTTVTEKPKLKIPEPPFGNSAKPASSSTTATELKPIAAGVVLRQPEGIANPKTAFREQPADRATTSPQVVGTQSAIASDVAAPTVRDAVGRPQPDAAGSGFPNASAPAGVAQSPPSRTPLPQVSADPSLRDLTARTAPPTTRADSTPAAPSETKRPILGRVANWFAGNEPPSPKEGTQPSNDLPRNEASPNADLVVAPREPAAPAKTATTSKPFFPRVRSFFTGDTLPDAGPSTTVYSDEAIAAETRSPSSSERRISVPETAQGPQNGRTIR